ncbi:MFS general substrate transporter [Pyrenophora seminiperda CCB06]|uniref:MFS general substrate transporter n=1 Tax=Pyrenophora seminiperda CCB06 TaxID=1302712 RepID=A0A3M7M088_9PLEO|nr:MFS general substrate transporter [Pyrenophora seminiperda CCB06]
MPYCDAETQTVWAGLTKMDVRPDILFTIPDTTTPPAEMIAAQKPLSIDNIVTAAQLGTLDPNSSSFKTLLERRQNRPPIPTRISLPNSELDDEVFPSPPPSHALLSPVPAANKRYAGHTPLVPRSPSPPQDEMPEPMEQQAVEDPLPVPLEDQPLIGPLMLPTNPVDGASDHIALDVLDDVLEKIAQDQERFSKLKDAPEPAPEPAPVAKHVEDDLPLNRKASADLRRLSSNSPKPSADSRKSSTAEVVDGVKLKTPPLNFGAPIGQV